MNSCWQSEELKLKLKLFLIYSLAERDSYFKKSRVSRGINLRKEKELVVVLICVCISTYKALKALSKTIAKQS